MKDFLAIKVAFTKLAMIQAMKDTLREIEALRGHRAQSAQMASDLKKSNPSVTEAFQAPL